MPILDLLLAAAMVATGAIALFARDRIASIAGFMVTGLLVALSWIRLGAPDVALAEAAIGAGLTGALFLRSARWLGPVATARLARAYRVAAATLAAAFAAVLFLVIAQSDISGGFTALVAGRIEESGVTNPVTAVLLNFRAWDTLLEIAVLFAALALVALLPPKPHWPRQLGPLFLPFARLAVPLSVLVAGHLLWLGATAPGGAFQAGSVLAGGILVLVLGRVFSPRAFGRAAVLALAVLGLVVFILAGLGAEFLTGTLLAYPEGADKVWILAIESGLTLSIAATLVLLFTGLPGKTQR